LTVDVSLNASDNSGSIAFYCLNESNDSATCNWNVLKPTSYSFSSSGNKSLYAWVKNAIGNISTPISAIVNVTSKAGDCDGNSSVTIAEVQSAINMFLGLKTVETCVNTSGDTAVSIAEVQKVINSFLGL